MKRWNWKSPHTSLYKCMNLTTSWKSLFASRCVHDIDTCSPIPVTLFTNWTDVLPQDLVKSPSWEIGSYDYHIALIFGWHLSSAVADVPVKFKTNWKSLKPNLATSSLHEIFGKTSVRLVNRIVLWIAQQYVTQTYYGTCFKSLADRVATTTFK